MDLQTARDWVIVVYGVVGIITFLVVTIVTAGIGVAGIKLVRTVRSLITDQVSPTISNVRDTSETIRARTSFLIDTAVRPVIKAHATISGIRRGLAVFSGLSRRMRDR